MNSEKQTKETQKKAGKKKIDFFYIFSGKILTEEFIIKQTGLFLMIFFLIIIFISNRYHCIKQLTEMDKLKRELIYLENEKINLNSRLTKISRQMQIEESLRRQGVELSSGNANIYLINK